MEHMSEYTLDRGYALCREIPNGALIRQKLEEYVLKNFLEVIWFLSSLAEKRDDYFIDILETIDKTAFQVL
ncbi:unnamed protein product [Ceratitis capitata]|uniref:(Mediterranean fruit fly) hypothetical protein n=1 Tax=Ceratitis capitata TaxID=7213 RepID=A0A811U9E7_CERCA|nr:unnamed protein product [Ceratitis capitata]